MCGARGGSVCGLGLGGKVYRGIIEFAMGKARDSPAGFSRAGEFATTGPT